MNVDDVDLMLGSMCPFPIELRCLVGSTTHGISIGSDDRDEMAICLEPLDRVLAFGGPGQFEHYTYRSAAEREHRHDAPSQAGDLDLTVYSLRKWTRLALQGNPTVLLLLFAPVLEATDLGRELQALAPHFASRAAGARFLGYLQSQSSKMLDLKKGRMELIREYGFDTKAAGHMIRLAFQGIEYLKTGKLVLPLPEEQAERVRDIRLGKVSLPVVLQDVEIYKEMMRELMNRTSPLPEFPNYKLVGDWVREKYLERWATHYTDQLFGDLSDPTNAGNGSNR